MIGTGDEHTIDVRRVNSDRHELRLLTGGRKNETNEGRRQQIDAVEKINTIILAVLIELLI